MLGLLPSKTKSKEWSWWWCSKQTV